jgi:ribonuclease HI
VAAAIYDEYGAVIRDLSRYLGRTTNNVAEYEGLLMGLEAMIQLHRKNILVQSDSQLMVRQLNGDTGSRVRNLRRSLIQPGICCGNSTRIVFCMCVGRSTN